MEDTNLHDIYFILNHQCNAFQFLNILKNN